MPNPGIHRYFALLALLLCATTSLAQGFGVVGSTPVRERLAGAVLLADGVAAVEPGDQLGAFVGDELSGSFTWGAGDDLTEYEIVIFGDIPDTQGIVEGPTRNETITVRFYDSSTDSIRSDVRLENAQGESVNYRYAGEEVPDLPVDLPGLDLTPTRALNVRIGAAPAGGGGNDGGDNGGGGSAGPSPDVDADGKVTTKDAALVLRIVNGGGAGVPEDVRARADVNGDGAISTADAIAILRNR